jgi:hypothetical protein
MRLSRMNALTAASALVRVLPAGLPDFVRAA